MRKVGTPKLRALMGKLRRIARRRGRRAIPSDGGHMPLIYEDSKNGWHYQGGITVDSRFFNTPQAEIFAFRPPRRMCARSADLVLREDL